MRVDLTRMVYLGLSDIVLQPRSDYARLYAALDIQRLVQRAQRGQGVTAK
jgi:hypothetical protein